MRSGRSSLICVALAALTFLLFWPVSKAGFISYDDPDYVSQNPVVQQGITVEGIKWAFTTGHSGNWHPITWISHMLDVQLFGDSPHAQHLINVCFHIANVLLLFLLLQKMTRMQWRSAVVAALFAVHPLHVESVAWISERKDVLSTMWALLATWFYADIVHKRKPLRVFSFTSCCFALALMSKPMFVTLPALFLLLDLWPLQRTTFNELKRSAPLLLNEKFPLLALAVLSSFVTYFVQQAGGAVRSVNEFGIGHRIANALLGYAVYLRKMLWPSDLAIFYPHAPVVDSVAVVVAAVVLITITCSAFLHRRKRPYLLIGWLWYIGMLLPVIGIIQVGEQAMADRYTYFPLVGVFVGIVWGISELIADRERVATVCAVLAVGACSAFTWKQASYWKDNQSLFGNAIQVIDRNYLAHNHLATDFLRSGNVAEAKKHLEQAVAFRPQFADARANLGSLLAEEGKLADAKVHLVEALRSNPQFEQAHYNLGNILKAEGDYENAADHFATVIQLNPQNADAHSALGYMLAKGGQMPRAIAHYSEAARLHPSDPTTQFNLATALLNVGETNLALEHYTVAVKLQPDFVPALHQLGLVLSEQGRIEDAVDALTEVVRIQPDYADAQARLRSLQSAMLKK